MKHSINRRRVLRWTGAAAGLGMAPAFVRAETRTVKLLVGFPPGGGTDAIARLLAERLKESLPNTTFIVENKAGAGGQLAAQALKAAEPDGNTLFLTHDHTVSILPLVVKTPGFDTQRDFAPVAGFASFANAWAVSGSTPAKSVAEYVDWVKKSGGKGAVGVPAPASVPEFLVKVLAQKFQLDLVAAPYRGSAPMMADMLGGQIPAGVGSVPDFMENHRAGKLRVVAVMGSARQAALPDVPTLAELGLAGFEELPFYGLFAPAATPKQALAPTAQALAKALAVPEVKDRLGAMGLTVAYMTPEQLAARENAYSAVWAKIIKDSGFQPQ